MAKKDKVSITYMLNQSQSWKDNHKVTVESEGKTPTVTLANLYKLVVEGFSEQKKFNQTIIARLDKQDHTIQTVVDRLDNVIKKNNLKE